MCVYLYIYHILFFHSPDYRHLDYFYFLIMISNGAEIFIYKSMCGYTLSFLVGRYLRGEWSC